jgi:hypothetical protein
MVRGQRFVKEKEEFEEFKEPVRVNGKDRIRECFVTGVATWSVASLARPKGSPPRINSS